MKVHVSVPGKIHLMGEHAIVYGKPAVIAAINLRLSVAVFPNSQKLQIKTSDETRLVEKAVEVVCQNFKIKSLPKVTIEVKSQIPTGRHAGSSAAISVATVSALSYYLKKNWDLALFNEMAYEVEKFQHGHPSGGDNSTCTFGGFIWYRKEFEFLKIINKLPLVIPSFLKKLTLVDTGRPVENTGEMVASVSRFLKNEPQKGKELLTQNEEATKEVVFSLKNNSEKEFTKAIKKGERTLEGLGVVSKKAAKFIRQIESAGGCAKILGGGGKKEAVGLLLCFAKKEVVDTLAENHGYRTYRVKLGEEGARLEKH